MAIYIETERLLLRPLSMRDLSRFEEIFAHPDFHYYAVTKHPTVRDYLASRIDAHSEKSLDEEYSLSLAVCLKAEDNLLIGYRSIGQKSITPTLRHLGWEGGAFIDPDYQKRGYATESLKALLCFAEKEYNQSEFFSTAAPNNIGSITAMTKNGYKKIGAITDPAEIKKFGGPRDIYYLNLTDG